MPNLLQRLKRASWGGIAIPWDKMSVRRQYRHHVHEYRRVAGGDIERHGLNLLQIHLAVFFDESLDRAKLSNNIDGFPGLMANHAVLMSRMAAGESMELVVPTLGTLKALLINANQEVDPAHSLSGFRDDFEFLEDSEGFVTIDALRAATADIGSKNAALKAEVVRHNISTSVFDTLTGLVDVVVTYRDYVNTTQRLLSEKIEGVLYECKRLNDTVLFFKNVRNWRLLETFKELWAAVAHLSPWYSQFSNIHKDAAPESPQMVTVVRSYVVPQTMSIQDVSRNIYKDSMRSLELMRLNDIPDILAIPPGTVIRYTKRELATAPVTTSG